MKEEKEFIPVALRKDFRKEYTIIDLASEYPGYRDDIPYAIVTELSEEEFEANFGKEINEYRPYMILTVEMFDVMVRSGLNDERERLRDILFNEYIGFETAILLIDELSNPARICESLFTMECIFKRMNKLPGNVGPRVYKKYVIGYSAKEIGEQEGITKRAVWKSIERALPDIHDIFVELGVVA